MRSKEKTEVEPERRVLRLVEVFPLAAPRLFYKLRIMSYTTEGEELRDIPVEVTRTTVVAAISPPALDCKTPCEWEKLPRGSYVLRVPDSFVVEGRRYRLVRFSESAIS